MGIEFAGDADGDDVDDGVPATLPIWGASGSLVDRHSQCEIFRLGVRVLQQGVPMLPNEEAPPYLPTRGLLPISRI